MSAEKDILGALPSFRAMALEDITAALALVPPENLEKMLCEYTCSRWGRFSKGFINFLDDIVKRCPSYARASCKEQILVKYGTIEFSFQSNNAEYIRVSHIDKFLLFLQKFYEQ